MVPFSEPHDRKRVASRPSTFVKLAQYDRLVKMGIDFEYMSSSVLLEKIAVME